MRFNTLFIGATMALSASFSTAASAAGEAITMSATAEPRAMVSVVDLNLASPSGMARVKGRIAAAAAKMCLTNAVEPVRMHIARANCYRAALSSGWQQLDRMTIAQVDQGSIIALNAVRGDARSGN